MSTFEAFPKIPRLRRECTITEKIDGGKDAQPTFRNWWEDPQLIRDWCWMWAGASL